MPQRRKKTPKGRNLKGHKNRVEHKQALANARAKARYLSMEVDLQQKFAEMEVDEDVIGHTIHNPHLSPSPAGTSPAGAPAGDASTAGPSTECTNSTDIYDGLYHSTVRAFCGDVSDHEYIPPSHYHDHPPDHRLNLLFRQFVMMIIRTAIQDRYHVIDLCHRFCNNYRTIVLSPCETQELFLDIMPYVLAVGSTCPATPLDVQQQMRGGQPNRRLVTDLRCAQRYKELCAAGCEGHVAFGGMADFQCINGNYGIVWYKPPLVIPMAAVYGVSVVPINETTVAHIIAASRSSKARIVNDCSNYLLLSLGTDTDQGTETLDNFAKRSYGTGNYTIVRWSSFSMDEELQLIVLFSSRWRDFDGH